MQEGGYDGIISATQTVKGVFVRYLIVGIASSEDG